MHTLHEYLDLWNSNQQFADKLEYAVQALRARDYVQSCLPDVHVVRTVFKEGKPFRVGIFSVELSLNRRLLIDTSKAVAPTLLGKVFGFTDEKDPDYVWALPAWLSAERYLKALETV
jgi:hypothetical protein